MKTNVVSCAIILSVVLLQGTGVWSHHVKLREKGQTNIADIIAEFDVMKSNYLLLLRRVKHNEIEISDLKRHKQNLEHELEITRNISIQNQNDLNETRISNDRYHDNLTEYINKSDREHQNKKAFIGFSAYMSPEFVDGHSRSLSRGRRLIFDRTETNTDDVYNTNTGDFIAPSSGMYAFSWTICVDSRKNDSGYGEFGAQLVVGGKVSGQIHADTEKAYDDDCSTGLVLKHVRKGGYVYLKNIYAEQGVILSNEFQTRTTFSGWKLN